MSFLTMFAQFGYPNYPSVLMFWQTQFHLRTRCQPPLRIEAQHVLFWQAETRARWNSTFPAQKKTLGSIRICQVAKSKIFGTRLQSQSGPLEHFLQLLGDFSHQHADTLDGYDTVDERRNSAPVGIPMKVT